MGQYFGFSSSQFEALLEVQEDGTKSPIFLMCPHSDSS